ncbi:group II intron reverse transcriptase/maturase [Sporolactobacillus shoreicorticis]|uniref:Group II intron reverse transcriptase/maturase n=1 Tax=Sporolactobacillus shoreicorticis TaxID=1923877 RepID=A0ABW5S9X6_9BACL|nr:group II intron reverse transcriptase/maturase [Sporolactobacillus shoreicorticis]MCO7128206.1 group II intron reverse transcriptase/maturase [Sporolactobacillus shoreicorticis]
MSTELRYYEYYQMQETFDWLYERSSQQATSGIDLYKIIMSEENILLAYRTIKTNTGSKTAGIDNQTISDFKIQNKQKFVDDIRRTLENYQPKPVRRVNILKRNGKTRPLGIPVMKDRLIQQMFKQVLEPICEARFFKHSYGFRPNRSTEHAIARCNFIAHKCKCHHIVDIDIKGFFDHVHHGKLIKQLFNIGIKDRRVLAVIAKMLKATVAGQGVSRCGVPQGGVLSTLLSNVVLNDLDWWIANQWETFETKKKYSSVDNTHHVLKKSRLKKMHIVRYCDDFKIFTNNHKHAIKIYHAVKGYIEQRLNLEIAPDKSRITNLRRNYSEFLGFELKVVKQKKQQYVTVSRVSKKAKSRIKKETREKIKSIRKSPTRKNINQYNQYVRGIQNYYQKATLVNHDFSSIYYSCLPALCNRLMKLGKYEVPRSPPITYKKFYPLTKKTFCVRNIYLFPLDSVKWKRLEFFKPQINNYTLDGRLYKSKRLKPSVYSELIILSAMETDNSIEYLDNRLSRYSMQNGKCAITGNFLRAQDVHCHHVIPRYSGGTDEFTNLVIVHKWVHRLIHSKTNEAIDEYTQLLQLSSKQLEKLNKYRQKCNLTELIK